MLSNEESGVVLIDQCGFLSLPLALIRIILTNYLTRKDMMTLDKSLSGHNRNKWFEILGQCTLYHVELYAKKCIIDRELKWIGNRRINIQNLYIYGNISKFNKDDDERTLSDDGLKELSNCTNLKSLQLYSCNGIRGDGLVELSKNCVGIESLNVSQCSFLSEISIIDFTANCPNLTY